MKCYSKNLWFQFMKAHHRYKNQVYETRMELILDILLYLVPGMAIFILAPTFVFQFFENWSFTEGIYYAFVSLTTIGFGDFVAGMYCTYHFQMLLIKIRYCRVLFKYSQWSILNVEPHSNCLQTFRPPSFSSWLK